jgi:hypothetical protein
MDYEERLINELKQIKHRKDINSGQHKNFISWIGLNMTLELFLVRNFILKE